MFGVPPQASLQDLHSFFSWDFVGCCGWLSGWLPFTVVPDAFVPCIARTSALPLRFHIFVLALTGHPLHKFWRFFPLHLPQDVRLRPGHVLPAGEVVAPLSVAKLKLVVKGRCWMSVFILL